ncbi:MAG: chorismate mutase [Devosiaceae bacterium]|nr:chorismate mutase [Devosiaceae bacterium MH13]
MTDAPAPQAKPGPHASLADIRAEIDRIDAAMHALLIERSAVIGDLITIKNVAASASASADHRPSAFRPAREASMMRDMIERHSGLLPLDTVESIWRVIISTFTYVQAPYDVAYCFGTEPLAMRDVARFHFGYTVPLSAQASPQGVLDAVGARGDALGLIPIGPAMPAEQAWWRALEAQNAPKVIARLPFVERADHPAGLPCLVVANAPSDPAVMAAEVFSVSQTMLAQLPGDQADEIDRLAGHTDGSSLISVTSEAIREHLRAAGALSVGSHAPVYRP